MTLVNTGLFISVEGIDGSGKTTQVERLCTRLAQANIDFVRTREPGGTIIGEAIRALLLDPASVMTPTTEAYLYAAGRAEHVRTVIRPALQSNKVVVCDRFLDASVAYQGYGMANEGLTPEAVKAINSQAVDEVLPCLTFVIDVPVLVAEKRLQDSSRLLYGGQDRIERRGRGFFERVRQGLQELHQAEPSRVIWLDGMKQADELEMDIWLVVTRRIEGVGDSLWS